LKESIHFCFTSESNNCDVFCNISSTNCPASAKEPDELTFFAGVPFELFLPEDGLTTLAAQNFFYFVTNLVTGIIQPQTSFFCYPYEIDELMC